MRRVRQTIQPAAARPYPPNRASWPRGEATRRGAAIMRLTPNTSASASSSFTGLRGLGATWVRRDLDSLLRNKAMYTINGKQRHRLRALAHRLKPVVLVGAGGLGEGLVAETDRALADHALIKVRLAAGDKAARLAQARQLAERTDAELIQLIGRIAILYRPSEKAPIDL